MLTLNHLTGFGVGGAAGGLPADPNAGFLKLALSGRGANGTTQSVSDSGGKSLVWNGDARISSAQSRFYGASLAFDGSGDLINAGSNADYVFTGDFRISAWVYTTSTANAQTIMSCYKTSSDYNGWQLSISQTTGFPSLYFSTGSGYITIEGASNIAVGGWKYIEAGRSGGTLYLSVDGVIQISSAYAGTHNFNTLTLGGNAGGGEALNGYLQDVLIYNGLAPRTTAFTPPTAGYANTYA